MLSENQCKRLLKQTESAWETRQEENLRGWLQALRLVLEVNGPGQIRNTLLNAGQSIDDAIKEKDAKVDD